MRPTNLSRRALVAAIPSILLLCMSVEALTDTVLPLGSFRSVTLHNGGHVALRHASKQRVTLLDGGAHCMKATIVDGDRLLIERTGDCPRRRDVGVEIFTPMVEDIMIMDGGTIQTRGSFPRQTEIRVMVEDGGTIDLRSMSVDQVIASVRQGGRILTKPQEALVAKIAQGGAVTYWGSPRVTRSVFHGGAVSRGSAADADKPLFELEPGATDVPPLPPIPPAPPSRSRGTF